MILILGKQKAVEVDFKAMETLGNEDVEVGELTDADMNDPDLLSALKEIESDPEDEQKTGKFFFLFC